MLKFIANLFSSKKHKAPVAPAPYKVEEPTAANLKPAAKKPAVKKAATTKPRKPRAPKA